MKKYDHFKIEQKFQKKWEKEGIYNTKEDKSKQKYYCLVEFPYASGEGLHVGHVRSYTALDIVARKKRMEGLNVLYPIGWDAFGLPTENYAIKTGVNPKIITKKNTNNFRKQLKSLGFSFDWSREINTSSPEYYKWTQWIFLQFFKHGLAYKKRMPINWCLSCKIGLANEEVVNGVCERCGGQVEKREKEQWMLAITKYAERLYDDLDKTEFLEKIKIQQRNWIGKSHGALISFALVTSQIIADKKLQINADGKIVLITNVQEFRENVNIDSKLKIEGREFSIKELIKFKLDDGSFYLKLFLSGGYVLADDLNSNSFILVKEKDTNLKIEEDDITFENKKYSFSYKAHAIAEEVFGEEIFKKGESETFWDYTSGNNYLSLGIVDKNKKRLDFLGKTIKADKIEVTNLRESASNLRSSATFTKVNVFTTRPDTLFGATYLVLAPEHELIRKFIENKEIENIKEVEKYISETAKKKDIDRTAEGKQKTGVELKGIKATNPVNKKEIPIFIADYVLAGYGTGAIMAVPAHDERDYAFTSQMNADKKTQIDADKIEIIKVIESNENLYTGYGKLINSGKFDGMESNEAIKEITKFVGGELKTVYSLRDWIFSRQRYWGEPIPLVFCNECKKRVENSKLQIPNHKQVPNSKSKIQNQEFNEGELLNPGWVVDENLPLELPDVKKYEPTDSGESPLASVEKWVNVKCPKCGGPAKRETDTMPNWAGSSWYWLRYTDPENDKVFADEKKLKYWTPVDWYNGGMEHTTLHLLYSRFWHKFLFDIGLVPTDEPYIKRTSHGMILGDGGEKMSKSRGNVINPDDIIERFGADSFRLYEMFLGPFDQQTSWNSDGVVGTRRFVEKVYGLSEKIVDSENESVNNFLNKTIKKVGEDIENMKFNTAISSMMMFLNFVYDENKISKDSYKKFLKILSPFAPHVTEELWSETGEKESIHKSKWPEYDEIKENENFTIVVQVDGKIRDKFIVASNLSENEIKDKAISLEAVLRWVGDKKIKKTIYIKDKLVNIVTI